MPDEPELPVNETIPLLKGSVTKTFYSVQSGDNLWNIAKSQNMTFDEIINLNPKFTRDGRNPNLIYPGKQVEVVVPNNGIVVTAKGKKRCSGNEKTYIEGLGEIKSYTENFPSPLPIMWYVPENN